jgi:hypothetical protein
MPTLRAEQLDEVGQLVGFNPQVATTLAAICAYPPLQEAMREAVKASCARENLSLAEGAMAITRGELVDDVAEESGLGGLFEKGKEKELLSSFYADDDEDDFDGSGSLRDYDHYKLKTHSFNEYRSEQDIACLLQVEEEVEVPGGADDWRETSLGARHDTRYEDIHGGAAGRGHAGEPGSMNDDSKWFGYLLVSATVLVSLGFLRVEHPNLFSIAIQSEFVKTIAALSAVYASGLRRWMVATANNCRQ